MRSFLSEARHTVPLVLFYYTFAIGLTFYNRWMFKSFHFPLVTTCVHFLVVFMISGFLRNICSRLKKSNPYLSWSDYMKHVSITGLASALDIGLSNWSFVFITVSLYTMVKTTAIVFILGFALLFGLEKPRCLLILIVLLISSGLFMFVYKSSQFILEGFILVLVAAFLGGLRWTLSQILAQKNELGLSNPIDLLFHLQPTMFIGLFPLAMFLEGPDFFASDLIFGSEDIAYIFPSIFGISIGAFLAFFLSYSEYLLLTNTSSLTLAVSGIFKEVCILILATTVNNDKLTLLNWLGFFACMSGICLHVYTKFKQKEEKIPTKDTIQMTLINSDSSNSDNESEIYNYHTQ